MALDKQKILNELGNVVNQLQSADCGCMGKLFANSNQPNGFQNAPMISPAHDDCMRGCCHGHSCGHHGYNAPGAGEPFSSNRNCMGYCNPPKLYADTYNYLNNNLMQPVVKEVYEDLKSISPANTMMNNPMGAQMGLSPGNPVAQGGMGAQMGILPGNPTAHGAIGGQMGNMAQNQISGGAMGNQNAMTHQNGPNVRFANSNMGNNMQMSNPNSQQQMAQPTPMSGMGPNIVNMMMGDAAAQRARNPNQGGPQGGNNAPQSPALGQYNGGMPSTNPTLPTSMGMNEMGQGNPGAPMQHANPQYMSHPNMYAGANTNMQGNTINGNMAQINSGNPQMQTMNPGNPQMQAMNPGNSQMQAMNSAQPQMQAMNPRNPQMQAMNPAQQQIKAQNPGYGQHSAGMTKFNEMFPGVMQGGDLGFDPMAIAIQMNPANQQKAAMDTMQKMMMGSGKGLDPKSPLLQPVINATNAAMANIAEAPTNQPPGQQNMVPTSMQQQIPANAAAAPVHNNQVTPQQAYTALTGAPAMNQQQMPPQQQQGQYQQQQQQQLVDPRTGAVVPGTLPTVYETSESPNARQEGLSQSQSAAPTTQQMIKEPIFPVDTTRNIHFNNFKHQHYNTLGQPVDMTPADIYRTPEPLLPQTLSPQAITRNDPGRYSNVKATVSKTSLMGNKPLGRTPSRGQLQQIYNQYKGSQSYTQQNIRPPDNNGASYSDRHINVTQGNVVPQTPIERIGGDTAANNAMNNAAYLAGNKPGQGDVPAANKPIGDAPPADAGKAPKVRNGLQDMKYTAYATSAAWSFHGATPAPYTPTYRFRYKV